MQKGAYLGGEPRRPPSGLLPMGKQLYSTAKKFIFFSLAILITECYICHGFPMCCQFIADSENESAKHQEFGGSPTLTSILNINIIQYQKEVMYPQCIVSSMKQISWPISAVVKITNSNLFTGS
jgi:hypothetical protein